jgi:hypothetical protein
MANQQDPKDIESELQKESKATDELTGEELDQVAGGGIEPSPFQGPSGQIHGPSGPPRMGILIEDKGNPNASQ